MRVNSNATGNNTIKIPQSANMIIFIAASCFCVACLKIASVASALTFKLLAAILFSYFANTMFSLLHEAVHGLFHPQKKINYFFGLIAASFYPTSFSLQKMYHLSHHKNNRSEHEQFDYIHEGDNKLLKYAQWYAILTGIYWVVAVIGALGVLIMPGFFKTRLLQGNIGKQTGATSVFQQFDKKNHNIIRLEILFAITVQAALIYFAGISATGWLLCYACFAINWSSLQYADHAFSELDAVNGAWNLKVNPITRYLFLNYHYHKVHHTNMKISWLYLPQFVDENDPMPGFWSIYFRMWRGPRPLPKHLENNSHHENI